MPDDDLMFRDAVELAAMVRSGEVSSRELVELSLQRIEELNPSLNAFVEIDAEGALAAAESVAPGDERPFAGVPVAIKNNRPVAGKRLTYGCPLMESYVVDYDHNVTSRLRHAGFVIVGTTTLPEYGILPVTEARIFGPTRNPWDLERTPGGSSGGAAAAVAAGLVPVAHGNDGGGSIRIPAACCGLVGLKPSRGRISVAPELGDSSLGIDGMLTRSVRDTAAILDVLAGYEPGDATWAPPPSRPFADAASPEPGRMRIAFSKQPPAPDAELDPINARGADDAAELLRSLGHEVVEADPPWRQDGLSELFGLVFASQIALSIAYSASVSGKGPDGVSAEDMEPMSWAIFSMIRKLGTLEQQAATVRLQAFARAVVDDHYLRLQRPIKRGKAREVVHKAVMRRLQQRHRADPVHRAGHFGFLVPGQIADIEKFKSPVREQDARAALVFRFVGIVVLRVSAKRIGAAAFERFVEQFAVR